MPSIRGFNIPTFSSLFCYLHGFGGFLWAWWSVIRALFYGIKPEDDSTLFSLFAWAAFFTFYYLRTYFTAAYNNVRSEKLMLGWMQVAVAVLMLLIGFFQWIAEKMGWELEDKKSAVLSLQTLSLIFFTDGAALLGLVRIEDWWERTKPQRRVEEERKSRSPGTSDEKPLSWNPRALGVDWPFERRNLQNRRTSSTTQLDLENGDNEKEIRGAEKEMGD